MLNHKQPDNEESQTRPSPVAPGADRPPTGIASLVGAACLIAVAANLGVPLLHSPVAMSILLTVAGYCLARAVHRCGSSETWRLPLVLGLAGRALPAVLLVVTLTGLYQLVTERGLTSAESLSLLAAITFTSNIVPFLADASFTPIDHLATVALVAQAAVIAPWLLTVGSHRIERRHRSFIMLGLAAVFALVRVGVTVADPRIWEISLPRLDTLGLIATWAMLDGLLVGLAIGTMPLASLHRHPTTRAVVPALAALAVLLAAPDVGGPVVTVGLRTINATALTALVLAATAIFCLPGPVDRVLAGPWLHRIGARSFGLFLWHVPFAYALSGGDPFRWQGVTVFVVVLTLSLAAATVSYRSIELPAQSTLRWLVRRWFPSDVIALTAPAPQREKWRRWDEISLDNLPRPARRRNPSVSVGRLWQHGDRTTLDDGNSDTDPNLPPGESAVAG